MSVNYLKMDARFVFIFAFVMLFGEVTSECKSDKKTCLKETIGNILSNPESNDDHNKIIYLNEIIFNENNQDLVAELNDMFKGYEVKTLDEGKSDSKVKVYDLSHFIQDLEAQTSVGDGDDGENKDDELNTYWLKLDSSLNKDKATTQQIEENIKKINQKILKPIKNNNYEDKKFEEKVTVEISEIKNNSKEELTMSKEASKIIALQQNTNNIGSNINESKTTDLKSKINDLRSLNYGVDWPHYDSYPEDNFNISDYPLIDYIELYKDTTNEFVPTVTVGLDDTTQHDHFNYWRDIYIMKKSVIDSPNFSCHSDEVKPIEAVAYPWIATIFAKNNTNDQFIYICDGALMSGKAVVTAAKCLELGDESINATDLIVVLGKRSLQESNDDETFYRIKQVIKHENFSSHGSENATNDLAILLTESPVALNDNINTACMIDADDEMDNHTVIAAMTTGWKVSGELTSIPFSNNATKCENNIDDVTTICNSYGNDIQYCPSYGGLYLIKLSNNKWYLNGIRTSDTTEKTICTNSNLKYTRLQYYQKWIRLNS